MSGISYPRLAAQIGGTPTVAVDVPICAVLIAIFVGLAAGHMSIFQANRRRGHKFMFNGLCFGFAMSRITACTLRLAWASKPTNSNLSLVASVFLNAGVVLVYIINNLLAWRLVRSTMPNFGWNRIVRIVNKSMLWFILVLIIPLIVIIILRIKKPRLLYIQMASSVIGKLAQTYFLVIAIEAVILLCVAHLTSRRHQGVKDPFGVGSWNAKVSILATTGVFALVEAGFRCGTTWTPAPLASSPAWWDSKAALYCFNFVIDILILTTMLLGRVDKRFHVPNGANGPMSYSTELEVTESYSKQ